MKDAQLKYLSEIITKIPHHENARLISYRDDSLAENDYLHSQLAEKGVLGNVISTYRDEDKRLHYIVDKLSNALILGATGTGKSSRMLAAQLMMLAESGKANLIITDSKGALYRLYAEYLRQRGYKVYLFNPTNYAFSEGFNPFGQPPKTFSDRMQSVGKDVKIVKQGRGIKYRYKGRLYADKQALCKEYEREIERNQLDLVAELTAIVQKLWPIESGKEPYWEQSSQTAILATLLQISLNIFALDRGVRTTIDHVNFANVKRIVDSFTVAYGKLVDRGFFSSYGETSIVYSMLKRNVFGNASNTAANILGFLEQALQKKHYSNFIYTTMKTTVEFTDIVQQKTALFIVDDECDDLSLKVTSLFISELFQEAKKIADSKENQTLERPLVFIIDEFAVLPKIEQVSKYVAYGRSRNIFLHIVLQSLSQLHATYGEEDATTILNNCNTTVYLGSNDVKTAEKFSAALGRCLMISPSSILNGKDSNIMLEECPVVPISQLSQFSLGDAYVKLLGKKDPIKAHLEASYECPEYDCPKSNLCDYNSSLMSFYEACRYDYNPTVYADTDDNDDDLF